ncbi:MAG: 3-hydroxyacyl-CoA dehydrogenase/enoyl-CoA hydratase family protein [Bryobacteraceae bacterium]|nr:3-hydroxyacyl-CoA dehydrogenase/enoyl-CoA hydratase family protein [Bryobacteraceae bacterium]
MRMIRRVAVLGAGTMGSRIAAHLANAGLQVLLLDVPLTDSSDRNHASKTGLKNAFQQRPAAFFTDRGLTRIVPGNFEDDLSDIANCDWVIEAVTERLDVKRELWSQVDKVRKADAFLSTNTSGIPLRSIADGFSDDFRRHFLGVHFFNPPRYLHLLEVIPGPDTDRALLRQLSDFCDVRLGKGVVPCKDTPNFIANRMGSFYGCTVYKLTVEGNYTIEEVDMLTGPLIGVPKSASYRLVDVIGLDTWSLVARNVYDLIPDDPWRERFAPPVFVTEMLSRGWTGDKAGQGFYKRVGALKEIHALDWKTLEYRPASRVNFAEIAKAIQIPSLAERLRFLIAEENRAGAFLWPLFRDVLLFASERVPDTADRIVEIDRAVRWGYGHALGPFELWDSLGFGYVCDRIEREGGSLPDNIERMRRKGAVSFYKSGDHDGLPQKEFFDLRNTHYKLLEHRPGVYVLADVKRARGVVHHNSDASLIDLADGVLCCELHNKGNVLSANAIAMLESALVETEKSFAAMVIANQGDAFCTGLDLATILMLAEEKKWDDLGTFLSQWQSCNLALKRAARPVVAAPFGSTLGAGSEMVILCPQAQASAELYMGFHEVAMGLIPVGGGCKELVLRLGGPLRAFEILLRGKVSGSAAEARELGFLGSCDRITMNPERLIGDAKALALSWVSSWVPGFSYQDLAVEGSVAFDSMMALVSADPSLTAYDRQVAEKLARVLSGGNAPVSGGVPEQYFLDLEREAFLGLCGESKTRERIASWLKTSKVVKN